MAGQLSVSVEQSAVLYHAPTLCAMGCMAQGHETLALPGAVVPHQGQVEWGPGQPDVVGGQPAHGRGLELDGL